MLTFYSSVEFPGNQKLLGIVRKNHAFEKVVFVWPLGQRFDTKLEPNILSLIKGNVKFRLGTVRLGLAR